MKNFAKVVDGRLVRAPRVLRVDGKEITCPSEETCRAYGYLPLAMNTPEEREGMYAVVMRYEVRDGAIYAVYDYKPIPTEESEVAQ